MRHVIPAALAALLPGAALAHPGHAAAGEGFGTGLLHPLGGIDHLLAMVAVGLWAAMLGGRALWVLPAGFLLAMAAGGALGSAGAVFGNVEPLILSSVIVLGAALALAFRPPLAASLGAILFFGFWHGAAHGMEGPAGSLAFGAGFVLATGGLHALGLAAGLALERADRDLAPRIFGGAATGAGLLLVFL